MAAIMIQLTPNERQILHLLIKREKASSAAELARLTGVSKRTVYYSLNNLRHLFKQLGVDEFEAQVGGFCLTDSQRTAAQFWLKKENTPLRKKDRISYIICAAICAAQPLRLKTLQDKFELSRNIIFSDLADVKKELAAFQLELLNSHQAGYYVQGDFLLMCTVFKLHISRLICNAPQEQLDFFDTACISEYMQKMRQLNAQLSLSLTEEQLLEIVYLLLMIHSKPMSGSMSIIDAEMIRKTRELRMVNEIFIDLQEHEKTYLAICMMNFSNGNTYADMWSEEIELWECTKRLINIFEIVACVSFENKQDLIHAIYMHMKLSCYNYRNKVPHINPLREDIRQNYPDLFCMTESCCERMMQDFPYPVDEDEIAYLTLHFGVAIHTASRQAEVAHVLITCPSITTSAQLLRAEIETKFNNIIVEDVVRAGEINEYSTDKKIDFVISTVSFDCRYPLIRVRPILTNEDKANIATLMALLDIKSSPDSMQLRMLLRIVRQNVDDSTYLRIREELNHYLNAEGPLVNLPQSSLVSLYGMLRTYGIRFVDHTTGNWKDEIRKTADPLLKRGCIQQSYLDKMIALGEAHGPYFVISDDIAIAHARPQDGVIALGLRLTIYREGLTIMEREGIRFLFVLSSPDQKRHLHILENIMALSHDEKLRNALCLAQNQAQALSLLEEFQ